MNTEEIPMPVRPRALLASLAALLATFALAGPAQAEKVGAYHIMPTPEYAARTGRIAQPDAGKILYYGGSVFSSVKVVSVIWGGSVNPVTVAGIPDFTAALVNSTYVDQMSQYDTFLRGTNGHRGTRQHILRGSFLGQVQITPANTSPNLTDADVQAELAHQITLGTLPPQDLNTLYMVYFPLGVSITLDNLKSCRDFGAYHFAVSDLKPSRKNLFYSVEPDCNYDFSSITYIASHEFVEAVTDNIPTPGSNPAFPQAWNRADGYEIGDICSGSGTLVSGAKSWTVTQYFLNTTNACSTGNYTSP
jgi:hypothetical protein